LLVTVGLCLTSVSTLRVPKAMTRRAAVATAVSLPGSLRANAAGNPLVGGEFSGYKNREYGDASSPAPTRPAKVACEEGQRLAPDGFGGKKCVGAVKPVTERVAENILGGAPSPSLAPSAPRPVVKSAPAPSTRSSQPMPAALTYEDLLKNSIANKEATYGRELTEEERLAVAVKLKSLLGK